MDKLILEQEDAMKAVERTIPNLKKLGKNNYTVAKLQGRLESLKENFTRCIKLHSQLRSYETSKKVDEIPYFRDSQFLQCEYDYETACDYIHEMIASLQPQASSSPLQEGPSGAASYFSQHPTFQLPQINLPTFSGDLRDWESFRDKFTALIINERNLSDVMRMHYSGSCLKGEASHLIRNLPITEANFKPAWQLVSSRYENKRCLVATHLQTLASLPQLGNESAKDNRILRDTANLAIQALRNLGQPVDYWDEVLIHFVANKLDKATRQAWELKLGESMEIPSYDQLDQFLAVRSRAFDALQATKPKTTRAVQSHAATATALNCPLCQAAHYLTDCPTFQAKTESDRFDYIKANKRCINCLSSKHSVGKCSRKFTCKKCNGKHHTMLHFNTGPSEPENDNASSANISRPSTSTVASHVVSKCISPKARILLATAWIQVSSFSGRRQTVRALLDQGSVTTLITENLAQRLHLPQRRVAVEITGIGETESVSRRATTIRVSPISHDGPVYSTNALILKTLTRYVPKRHEESMAWPHLQGLTFADNDPMSSHPIEIIIGADLYGFVLLDGIRAGSLDEPTAQNSIFGWIISGPVNSRAFDIQSVIPAHHCNTHSGLDFEIRHFWETEELPHKTHLTPEEQQCEDHFLATYSRDVTGRYIVRLPFKQEPPIDIGESKSIATKMLSRLENRLQNNPGQPPEYNTFLDEYLRLGHMKPISHSTLDNSQNVYIPHHSVLRDRSATTHLRVVFNASSHTSNGTSLNDHLMIGPKLQSDLSSVILRWRQYRYILTSDIAKMYRHILVDSRDIDYQRILWRPSPSHPVEEFQLKTVTYGTAPAPFLALRVLQQLVKDEGTQFPLAIPVLRNHIYVDDCVFGADDQQTARETRDQLIALLQRGQFQLRKWASNSDALINDLNSDEHGRALEKSLQADDQLKVLGIAWSPNTDTFKFRVTKSKPVALTNGAILSMIAKIFDPLGWVTPVTVSAKILMQRLWLQKCDWDSALPPDISSSWNDYYSQLPQLEDLALPRWTNQGPDILDCELHGYADASSVAYAAVLYLRVTDLTGQRTISLLTAKSKVAPVKPMTIPRLELSAALLLSRLIKFVMNTLDSPNIRCYCWTDSTVTLCWLSQSPARWKTFVANRVAEIQSLVPTVTWRHIPTQENPADCASRGLGPSQLLNHTLWWKGPSWLLLDSDDWPQPVTPPVGQLPETRSNIAVNVTIREERWDLATRISSWPKLLRVTAYVMRFVLRTRSRIQARKSPSITEDSTQISDALDPSEIEDAKLFWLRWIQKELFAEELRCLVKQQPVHKKRSILSLNPFLDKNKLIRVGGRSKNSELPDQEKHPIVLKNHPLVLLIISHAHLRALHAGPQLTLCLLRQEYWILRTRPTIRAILHKCVPCVRERAALPQQLMGDLPDVRVTRTTRVFLHCGLDYAGPILLRTSPGRGHRSHKAYIALFVCMVIKAVRLELVNDYSTAAFLAAYNRFCARRGLPTSMYSDNGTTFQGADRELTSAFRAATRDPTLLNKLATDQVRWHFIPPSAPHFGGLWESGIRSVKYHLRRIVGAHTFTYEEFSTLLCQVEACLNSRPLAPISEGFDDYSALTPGHFLIGSAITTVPAPSLLELKESRLSRWQLLQQMSESFWRRWSQDYMQGLQQRVKWRSIDKNMSCGQLVLLRHPNLPPCKWELGRITECHPGDAGITRVVTVKTASSEYKRPIVKLCLLPVNANLDTCPNQGDDTQPT